MFLLHAFTEIFDFVIACLIGGDLAELHLHHAAARRFLHEGLIEPVSLSLFFASAASAVPSDNMTVKAQLAIDETIVFVGIICLSYALRAYA
jgi:hypothetical protein